MLEARGDSPDAKAALSELCAAYYAPVFAFIRRNAPDEDAAIRDGEVIGDELSERLVAGRRDCVLREPSGQCAGDR